jgi:uncharacterized protein (TIGR02391 family)
MLPTKLRDALLPKLGISQASLTRRAQALARAYGPMTTDDAKMIMAHDAGIELRKYVPLEMVDHIRVLRQGMHPQLVPELAKGVGRQISKEPEAKPIEVKPPSRRVVFNERNFHHAVVRSAEKLFASGFYAEAVRKTYQALNNRVKRLAGLGREDGQELMSKAFRPEAARLQLSSLSSETETNEQKGLQLLAMGAMSAVRNPNTHEDDWSYDIVEALEALALASLLHRYVDRCEGYQPD